MIHSTEEAIARIEAIPELQNKLAYDHFTEPQNSPLQLILTSSVPVAPMTTRVYSG